MPTNALLDILYEDSSIVVVNKPGGLTSVPGKGHHATHSLTQRILHAYPSAPSYPAVHRLDMDTTGIMLFALTPDALKHLSRQFQERLTEKEYIAILEKPLSEKSGSIELAFRLDPDNRPHQVYDPIHGKTGITHWQLIANNADGARVLFRPHTGRTHQLRLHASHPLGLDNPIIGDNLYGRGNENSKLKLHASKLTFSHPETHETITITNQPTW